MLYVEHLRHSRFIGFEMHSKPLDLWELEEIYRTVTKSLPGKSPAEVQEKLDRLKRFLTEAHPRLSYRRNSLWKTLKALEEHGRKYGIALSPNHVRVDIGWLALQKQAHIGSSKTLKKAIDELEDMGMITRGQDKGGRTGHFILDLDKATDPSCWNIEEGFYSQGNKCDVGGVHSSSPDHKKEMEEFKEALTHPTWYRGVGPSKTKYLLAVLDLSEEATAARISEYIGVNVNSVYAPLNELKEAGMIEKTSHGGAYRVTEDLLEKFYNFRSGKEEFLRDDKAKKDAAHKRRAYRYQQKLSDEIGEILTSNRTMPFEQALQKAIKENPVPTNIDRRAVPKIQDRALRAANKRYARKISASKENRGQDIEQDNSLEDSEPPKSTKRTSSSEKELTPDDKEWWDWVEEG